MSYNLSHLAKPESSYISKSWLINKLFSEFALYEWSIREEMTTQSSTHSSCPYPANSFQNPHHLLISLSDILLWTPRGKYAPVYATFVSQITPEIPLAVNCITCYSLWNRERNHWKQPWSKSSIAQLAFEKEGTTSIDVSGLDVSFSHSPPNIC